MKCKMITLLMMFVLSNYLLSAQELRVASGTNIKVETGTTLDVSSGQLILESNASGDATVITLGNITGNAIVHRYLPGGLAAWHMISSPVSAMAITGSNWDPETNEYKDLYLWHEPSPGIWVNFKNQASGGTGDLPYFDVANGNNNFTTGRSYLTAYNTANLTNDFNGPLTTGNVNITLTKTTAKSWDWSAGFNLIGNPYASGLNWTQVIADNTGILHEAYAQVYNPNKSGGAGYEQPTTIGSGQGFFVLAASDGATLNLTPSQQVHTTSATFLKETSADYDKLVLRLAMGTWYDETKVIINEESLFEHDFWDATKFNSFDPQVPQINTLISGTHPLAINSIPAVSPSVVIPVAIKVPADGNMTISLSEISGAAFTGQTIILHDLLTNTLQTLSENPTYHFDALVDDNPNRFLLKFGVLGLPEYQNREELKAYMSNHLLYILNPDTDNAQIEIYNLQGQVLLRTQIEPGLQNIEPKVCTGIYMVVMRTSMNVATRKIFIQ